MPRQEEYIIEDTEHIRPHENAHHRNPKVRNVDLIKFSELFVLNAVNEYLFYNPTAANWPQGFNPGVIVVVVAQLNTSWKEK